MTKEHDLRNISLNLISSIINDKKFVNIVLSDCFEHNDGLDKTERAFITRLVTGTIEQLIFIDYVIGQFVKTPLKKLRPAVLNILRLSVYQLIFMDSVPDRAVCSEAVKLAKKRGFSNLSGFINGVLRNIVRDKDNINFPDKEKETIYYLSIKYSMPEWIVENFLDIYNVDTTENVLKWYVTSDSLTVRCNESKADIDTIINILEAEGVTVKQNKYFKGALELENTGALNSIKAFREGYVQVQDFASMLPGLVLPIKAGNTIIDVCAAPGGKSLHAADRLKGSGKVISCDISEEKVAKILENIERCGFKNITARVQNALEKDNDMVNSADIVIADLPCSGIGIIGKKPDIKYNITKEAVEELSKLQRDILSNVWEYVKPGGYLLYSTCTLTSSENTANYSWILENLPFEAVSIADSLPKDMYCETLDKGYIQLVPGEFGTDGFFVALFRRKLEDN